METREYLNSLVNFYTEVSKYPLARISVIDENTCKLVFRNDPTLYSYNLGFKIRNCSWCTNKHASANILKLERILASENDTLLIGLDIHGNKLCILLYDKYGKVVAKEKLRYLSVNI